jgi:nitric oxide reductase NorQ protein
MNIGGKESMGANELTEVGASVVSTDANQEALLPERSDGFVCTPHVQDLTERALTYLEVGCPVHLSGPAGTGKTTLALHIAARLGRPVTLIHGDADFGSSDLIGRDSGYRKSTLVDNYIHSVLKTEEQMQSVWVDNRLTTAALHGDTLIYDEFNRSHSEANNVLLSVLSEHVLNLPRKGIGGGYVQVHPQFRAIFTSNPEEYAGVHRTQDALLDRLITMPVDHYDRETEIMITVAKSGIARRDAEMIVDIVGELRGIGVNNHRPTIRACIAMARVLALKHAHADWDDPVFRWVSRDVLSTDTAKVTRSGEPLLGEKLEDVIRKVCSGGRPAEASQGGRVISLGKELRRVKARQGTRRYKNAVGQG